MEERGTPHINPEPGSFHDGARPQRNNNFDFSKIRESGGVRLERTFGRQIRVRISGCRITLGWTRNRQDVDPHRIIRAGIPFGPEVSVAEAANGKTATDRGLMFVCYQTSIPSQFEFVQIKWANNAGFIFGKTHPDGTSVTVGFDPIIGQNASPNRARTTDEPVPNYPTGNVRSTLNEPNDFIIPTAAGYFFVPSIEALTNELSA